MGRRDTPTLLPRHCLSVLGIEVRRSGLLDPNLPLNLMAEAACAGQTLGCHPTWVPSSLAQTFIRHALYMCLVLGPQQCVK